MATRQKDVKAFFKKLKKRYLVSPRVLSSDRKIIEHLVFSVFLENASFECAKSCFVELQRYFIDWNEIRVSTANEIAGVVPNAVNPVMVGERLRRLLQWIFDKTYKFELEDLRIKGRDEVYEFLKASPFSTSFMTTYATEFAFGGTDIPLDELSMRVLRLLGYVTVKDELEVVECLKDAFNEVDAREFFFALHELSVELANESTKKDAMKFLASFDSSISKRSSDPLVENHAPTDPREIARLYSRRERRPKTGVFSPSELVSELDDEYEEKNDPLFDSLEETKKEEGQKGKTRAASGPSEEAYISPNELRYTNNKPSSERAQKKSKSELSTPTKKSSSADGKGGRRGSSSTTGTSDGSLGTLIGVSEREQERAASENPRAKKKGIKQEEVAQAQAASKKEETSNARTVRSKEDARQNNAVAETSDGVPVRSEKDTTDPGDKKTVVSARAPKSKGVVEKGAKKKEIEGQSENEGLATKKAAVIKKSKDNSSVDTNDDVAATKDEPPKPKSAGKKKSVSSKVSKSVVEAAARVDEVPADETREQNARRVESVKAVRVSKKTRSKPVDLDDNVAEKLRKGCRGRRASSEPPDNLDGDVGGKREKRTTSIKKSRKS